ncbi:MAG: ATP-dependent DNA helicase RecG [Candidatus Omnitrophica bacterium]|nr:ATP-dependent DNA helicase RecG [Candidatus Omnitrophota bacterium]
MQAKKWEKTNIRYLKGVGPKKAEILQKLNINTIEDLLYYLPRRYEDRSKFTLIKDLKVGEHHVVRGKVLTLGNHATRKGMRVFQIAVGDKTGVIYCVWFNQPFLRKLFKVGQEITLYGKVEKYKKLQINHPEYEFVTENNSLNMGRIVPAYSLTQDITQRYIRFLTHEAITRFLSSAKGALPTRIMARAHLVDFHFAIRNIHFPASFANLDRAYRRLVFEEFFILQLALALKKKSAKTKTPGIRHNLDANLMESFKKLFSFELTNSQFKAINEVQIDMANPKPMNRLLEGDVGSGKTAVAIYALLLDLKNGYQSAFMAPTEILARQHYMTISELLMPLGVNVRLLVSGLKSEKKLEIKKEIDSGEVDIVIGTHALIWEDVEFKKLGLAIIDEQHKFGVSQRQLLQKKGWNPDILLMTATPIPRTLALTVYGDLDISVIKELPGGRQPITTYCIEEENRQKVYQFIKEEIGAGRQAYIVYSRIWSSKNIHASGNRLKAATAMYNKLQEEIFPDLKVGLMHGRMNAKEKEAVMKKFKSNKINILVSTTVIEVGIDIPNASVMMIENAECFGLSQLHQMRGRIGRGEYPSYCILMGNPCTESAKRRFFTMAETQDGFKVAAEDLELRGPGEFFGTRQHGGLPELRFGNILKDFDIMEQARAEAFRLVEEDPDLEDPRNSLVKEVLKRRFSEKLGNENVPFAISNATRP